MKIACNQPNFIPWAPYFDLISKVDIFFILDTVQPGKKNFIVRNKIVNPNKNLIKWITVPIEKKLKYSPMYENKLLIDTKINHYNIIKNNYIKFINDKKDKLLSKICLENNSKYFSEYNFNIIKEICKFIGIKTKFKLFSEYFQKDVLQNKTTDYLVKDIIKREKATTYINFQNGIEKKIKPYDDEIFFKSNSVSLIKQNPYFFHQKINLVMSILFYI